MKIKQALPLMLLSFVLATFVWFLAKQGSETIQMHFFAQLVFRNLPPNMQINSELSPSINVSGRIERRHSTSFNPAGTQAVVDLTNARAGTFRYTLTRQNITVPEIMAIDTINPSQIELFIEEIVEKTLPITPQYQGQIQERYILKKIEIDPPSVKIRGPKSTLEDINVVLTDVINLNDLNQSVDVLVQLDLPYQTQQLLDDGVETYVAHISIESVPIRKLFSKVRIELLNQTYETAINPKTFNLYLEGPEDLVNSLDSSSLYGTIDVAEKEPSSYKEPPIAVIPEGLSLLQQWPPVSVWIKPKKLPPSEPNTNATSQTVDSTKDTSEAQTSDTAPGGQ